MTTIATENWSGSPAHFTQKHRANNLRYSIDGLRKDIMKFSALSETAEALDVFGMSYFKEEIKKIQYSATCIRTIEISAHLYGLKIKNVSKKVNLLLASMRTLVYLIDITLNQFVNITTKDDDGNDCTESYPAEENAKDLEYITSALFKNRISEIRKQIFEAEKIATDYVISTDPDEIF